MSALYFASCDRDSVTSPGSGTTEVMLKLSVSMITRSVLNCDADAVRNLSLYFFDTEDGTLTEHLTGKDSEADRTVLKAGSYNVYALANIGDLPSFDSEDDIRRHAAQDGPAGHAGLHPHVLERHDTSFSTRTDTLFQLSQRSSTVHAWPKPLSGSATRNTTLHWT